MAAAPAAVAAGAAVPGLNALLLPLLLSFGPAALNRLLGGEDPKRELRRQIMDLLNPATRARLSEQFYRQNLQSPAFAAGQGAIATGANVSSNQLAQSLGARGLGTSGTGAILSSLTPSLIGKGISGLHVAAQKDAADAADQSIRDRIAALSGTQGPSETRQFVGAGIDSFTPYLAAYLRTKYPTFMPPAVKVG